MGDKKPVFRFVGEPAQMKDQFDLAQALQLLFSEYLRDRRGFDLSQLKGLDTKLRERGVIVVSPGWFVELLA